jgi:alkanesulfonate monooxygenase SsuD/methylene tetrahydromethanopterin reductase-like flavin-dependent oxidoreductase (luciferase family)
MVVVGNPDEVIRKLENFQKAGLNQVICFKQAGRIPHQNIMQSIRRMGKYILPHFNPQRTIATDETRVAAL